MVLPLKRWKSRASPGIAAGAHDRVIWKNPFIIQKADRCRSFDGCPPFLVSGVPEMDRKIGDRNVASLVARDGAARRRFAKAKRETKKASGRQRCRLVGGAGWSSPVARQAHNLKVVGSNPTPATNKTGPLAGPFLLVVARAGLQPRSAGAMAKPLRRPRRSREILLPTNNLS